MKAPKAIHAELNAVLGVELIAINQFFLHGKILKNWGFEALSEEVYEASIEVMKDADDLMERILFLEGLPNLQDLGRLSIGEDVGEILNADLGLEVVLRNQVLKAIAFCEKESDFISRETLAKILNKGEERLDFLETQIELIGKLGVQNYLQTAVSELGD